ncbi:Glycine oxidase ThiO [Methylophaga frappieri]|uniref:D-amino-acid oxidase n=1 Tax=Methylophaga frappieri (strain ATCC BAA-2434 / DSM 25690 / JAM7) TaxID=754477 RepID=I1YEH6_METFJ|nr:FAD-dependent oxidoreductase [Methylophaga frappieri]AFJ01319.1 Glycine oxidase ThiO [Methylophaga frappieri]
MAHYLIIGSGLIGRLTAWRLLHAGHQVTILSSDDFRGTDSAGYVAAAMVAPYAEAVTEGRHLRDLASESLAIWDRWLDALPEPVFFPRCGTAVVAHDSDNVEFERYYQRAMHTLTPSDFQYLTGHAMRDKLPALADHFSRAIWFDDEGCLDNRQLFRSLTAFLKVRADWRRISPVEHLDAATLDHLCQTTLNKKRDDFTLVIDCRGNGSRADIASLRSVRGEVIRVHAPAVSISHCVRLLHPRYPLYLVPRPNQHYVIGATIIETADRSPVSVRSAMELFSALYTIDTGFAEARIVEMQAHCRPAMPDHLPLIQQQPWGVQLNGFYRHGYLLAPIMIERLLAQLASSNKVGRDANYT